MVTCDTTTIIAWKSKELLNKIINPHTTPTNSLTPILASVGVKLLKFRLLIQYYHNNLLGAA